MIIGAHSIDQRRVVSATYIMVCPDTYVFKIGYVLGETVAELDQFGSKEECIKWLKKIDTIMGKSELIDAISDKHLEEEEDDDDEECKSRQIGFRG